jgi:hypothetical protein
VLVIALLVVGAVQADPSFVEGKKLYDQLEYEQAVFRFEELATKASLSPSDRAQALLWLGLSYAGAGNFDAAKRAFSDAAKNDATVALPIEVSKRLAKLFADAKVEGVARAEADTKAAAAAPPPPPPPPPAAPVAAPKPTSSPPYLAYAGIGGGVLALAGGAALGGLCAVSYGSATNKAHFASDAKASLDQANIELAAAAVLVPVGVAISAASTFFAVTAP